MSGPNYDNYSMAELQEALKTVDEQAFPERAAKIRERMEYFESAKSGLQKLELDTLSTFSRFMIIALGSGFAIGAIASYFNNRRAKLLPAFCWALFSAGFQFWRIQWWPTAQIDIPISMSFEL